MSKKCSVNKIMDRIEMIPAQWAVGEYLFNTEEEAKQHLVRMECRETTFKVLKSKVNDVSIPDNKLRLYSLVYGDYHDNERDLMLVNKVEILHIFKADQKYYTVVEETLLISDETFNKLNEGL